MNHFACSYIVYGDSGGGKTTSLGTLDNPYIAYTDINELSLRRLLIHHPNADAITVRDWGALQAARLGISKRMHAHDFPHSAVCLDGLTETEIMLFRGQLGQSFAGLKDWAPKLIPAWRDEVLAWLEFKDSNVYEVPVDVVFTARVSLEKAEFDGRMWASIAVPGRKLGTELFAWCDEIFHIRSEAGYDDNNTPVQRYYLRTASDDMFRAKDGSGTLEIEEEPDLNAIRDKIDASFNNMTEGEEA